MLTIRSKQLETLESAHRSRRRTRIWRIISAHHANLCHGVSDEDALERIDMAIKDGRALGIVADEDVVRLAVLAFLPENVRYDPIIASVLIRVLNNEDWEPAKRLDFLHKHIVARVYFAPSEKRVPR